MAHKKITLGSILKKLDNPLKDKEKTTYRVALYIDPEANKWNRAAIELSEERSKIPSRRNKIVSYPVVTYKKRESSVQMSTNEWNSMALQLESIKKKRKEQLQAG